MWAGSQIIATLSDSMAEYAVICADHQTHVLAVVVTGCTSTVRFATGCPTGLPARVDDNGAIAPSTEDTRWDVEHAFTSFSRFMTLIWWLLFGGCAACGCMRPARSTPSVSGEVGV